MGGQRKTFGSKVEAETYADQCRARRANEGATAFGNEELASFGKTVQNAIDFYLAHLRQEDCAVPVSKAVSELIAVRRGAGRSPGYCANLRQRLGRYEITNGSVSVSAVTSASLDSWLSALPVAPGTRNTFRRDLRTLFSFCVKRGYCATNPAAATEVAKLVDAAPAILNVEEAERLLKAAEQFAMVPYVAIGLFAGLRADELAKLDWSEVNPESGFIEVKAHKAKTKRRRLVKISSNLRKWLEPHRTACGPVSPLALRYRWDDTKRTAGFITALSDVKKLGEAHLTVRAWPSNALRHSFGSYWIAQHRDAAALALQMGNSPAIIFQHYRELVQPKDAKQYWSLAPS